MTDRRAASAVVPADVQSLDLDAEQENTFFAEWSRIHPESTAQEMRDIREPDRTKIYNRQGRPLFRLGRDRPPDLRGGRSR
jgi:hypothetical protein